MRHQKIWTFVVAVMALAGTLAHAEAQMEEPAADRLPVVATTNIVGDIVARVGGDRLSLYVMLPPGADPHAFRASSRDARQVTDAAVVFINGSGLEAGFLGDLIASAEPRLIVDLTAHLNLRRMEDEHEEGEEHEHERRTTARQRKSTKKAKSTTRGVRHGHDHEHGESTARVDGPDLARSGPRDRGSARRGRFPSRRRLCGARGRLAGSCMRLTRGYGRGADIPDPGHRPRRIRILRDRTIHRLDTIIPASQRCPSRRRATWRPCAKRCEYGVPRDLRGPDGSSQTGR